MNCNQCEYCNSGSTYQKKECCNNYNNYNLPERLSVQGFHSCNCCDYDKCDTTQLVPVNLFQCTNPCSGICFTNCVNGVLDGCKESYYTNNDFCLVSSFSNFSIIGLSGVCKVMLQYYTNPSPMFTPCTPCNNINISYNKGPTVQGTPIGKLCTNGYVYNVSNDCFKFGPVHLGVDNWLQAIPDYNNCCKDNSTIINYSETCSKECKPYEIYKNPLQLKVTLYTKCKKCPICVNFCVYLLAKEGTCLPKCVEECDPCIDPCC